MSSTQEAQWKPAHDAEILDLQFDPFNCRYSENPDGVISDGNLKKLFNRQFNLSTDAMLLAESAKQEGQQSFTHQFGNKGTLSCYYYNTT